MAREVEFGDRESARRIRNNPKFEPFLSDKDDRRESTVVLRDDAPEKAVEDISGEAADSMSYKADRYGQAELTEAEKNRIDFSETNVMHARSAKAIARGKGVDDWTSFYDETLEVDEHRDVFEAAKKDEVGRSGIGRDRQSEAAQAQRAARAHKHVKEDELGHAKDAAFEGDDDAQGFVQERVDEPGGSLGEVFDVSFSRDDGRVRGSGRDYERLEERHEERSERARTADEKRTAQVTRNPIQWLQGPNRFDFPGIDTVQPAELHEERSSQARAMDERDAAPIADNKQQWAMAPGVFDWIGVDDVNPESFHAARPKEAQTRDEKEIAPKADSKQQWAQNPGRYDWPGVDLPSSYGPTMDADIPSTERNTEAPEPLTTELLQEDVSLAPEEAFEGVGSGSQSRSGAPFGFAGDEAADVAFVAAEEERSSGPPEGMGAGPPDAVTEEWADDRDREGSLAEFGMETDGTTHRESREAVEQASEFGVDDRSDASRGSSGAPQGGIQEGLANFGEEEDDRDGGLLSF